MINIKKSKIFEKALSFNFLSPEEGLFLYENASTAELMHVANEMRLEVNPGNNVGWIIDRNVNITNVCMAGCKFCNFSCSPKSAKAYVTSLKEYNEKINELFKLGGNQILLQGGMNPELGINFYEDLFKTLKTNFPELKLHALGPPEIVYISKKEGISFAETLKRLTAAGLDSLPGAGAEILVDRVRNFLSKNKCTVKEWLDCMREAHKLNILTSATMMFGHIETMAERIQHLIAIREVQAEKPKNSVGFTSFIPWPFQDEGTVLRTQYNVKNSVSANEYIRMIALSRIMLPNIKFIQPSWLTVGKTVAQICLHGGANDFGSIMIEENVVSVAGADYHFDARGIQRAIREAGFSPRQRNQTFEIFN